MGVHVQFLTVYIYGFLQLEMEDGEVIDVLPNLPCCENCRQLQ